MALMTTPPTIRRMAMPMSDSRRVKPAWLDFVARFDSVLVCDMSAPQNGDYFIEVTVDCGRAVRLPMPERTWHKTVICFRLLPFGTAGFVICQRRTEYQLITVQVFVPRYEPSTHR